MKFTIKNDFDAMLDIQGAKNISFNNISFEGCGCDVIKCRNSENIVADSCDFNGLLGYAMDIKTSLGCSFINNNVHNLSMGVVYLSGGSEETLTNGNNICKNNEIFDYALEFSTYYPAVQLGGVGNSVSHNKLYNAPHMAIGLAGVRNLIEYNEISNVCRETSDCGAIYGGRTWMAQDNKIYCNYFHDITKNVNDGASVNGVYLDDLFSSAEVKNNVFYNVYRALFIGGGRDNTFENNVTIDCAETAYADARGISLGVSDLRDSLCDYYRNNLWKKEFPLLYNILEDNPQEPLYNHINNNAMYRSGGIHILSEAKQYIDCFENYELENSDVFTDYSNKNFKIPEKSSIYSKISTFNIIPFEKMGLED